ncbi:sortase B [Acetitomaculum ruminis DSM 5522]|uniref:Sortase B n=1 Tax=Acetitomaculum ruminis DSM 5522 TaxID=1120918 RepID=A0A1I0XQ72_9FIRM|nr:class B sortase [Acetitomaculum ruminis]SFB03122.1 sortase B [Acetitomaculum ruminis DSM 5522]
MEEKKKKNSKAGYSVIIVIGLCLILFSAVALFYIGYGYYTAQKEYKDITQEYLKEDKLKDSDDWWYKGVHINFDDLEKINPDVIGWIRFDNLGISYPIMQTDNDKSYLKKTFFGNKNSAGSIFLSYMNSYDFSDYHSIIFGHNMIDGSMFAKLKKYADIDFYKENKYYTIYTKNKVIRVEIFSASSISPKSDIYTIYNSYDDTYPDFVKNLKEKSTYDTGVEVNDKDRVITLSTCYGDYKRFVVHGKIIKEKENK